MSSRLLLIFLTALWVSGFTVMVHAQDTAILPDAVITKPIWLKRPVGLDLAPYYPKKALSEGLSGGAVVECRVTSKGRMSGCKIVSETPPGYDFGEAVTKLAYFFQIAPTDGDGAPTVGRPVRISLNYRLPGA